MNRNTFKRILQIVTVIIVVFLVLFYIPVGADLWSDRNYAPGSAWPAVFKASGIAAFVIVAAGWLYFWTSKN